MRKLGIGPVKLADRRNTTRHRRSVRIARRWLAYGAISGVVLLSGCGGADEESNGSESDSTPTATIAVREDEFAASLLLTVEDFPSGWAEVPSMDEDETLEGCPTLRDSPTITGDAETGDFSRGALASVSQHVALFTDEEAARAGADVIEEAAQCIVDAINDRKLDDAEATSSDATLGRVSFSGGSFAYSMALRISFVVTSREDGMEIALYIDLVYESEGRVVSYLAATEAFTPFDTALLERLSSAAADRIAGADIPSLEN